MTTSSPRQRHDNILQRTSLRGQELFLLLVLSELGDEEGVCTVGREEIARYIGLKHPQNIRPLIKRLIEAGELIYYPGVGRGRRSIYVLTTGGD